MIKEYRNLPPVECYAGQLNQVFMNMIANAIDALEMGHRASGIGHEKEQQFPSPKAQGLTIWIRTDLVESDWVQIQIADSGTGMTPEVMAKIFDPFYTTKPIGYGTGLGLAISYQIVKTHQGYLRCVSEIGKGTEFVIEIPLTSKGLPQSEDFPAQAADICASASSCAAPELAHLNLSEKAGSVCANASSCWAHTERLGGGLPGGEREIFGRMNFAA
ncbi:sensor histidine kinase [Kamptonema formosum]|uniref:sensor histidine kinase n=1 Tax=Kamptonema formosum TaxID=331992 RepID=UPI00034A15BE|nr:ATP-binding protein [Oscillatoria sp. PCC 10802]